MYEGELITGFVACSKSLNEIESFEIAIISITLSVLMWYTIYILYAMYKNKVWMIYLHVNQVALNIARWFLTILKSNEGSQMLTP